MKTIENLSVPLQNINTSIEGLTPFLDQFSAQLNNINQNIELLNKTINSNSFFDSQLFAGIIGALAVLIAVIFGKYLEVRQKNKETFLDMVEQLARQGIFYNPTGLFGEAKHTIYGHKGKDDYGEEYEMPEKTIGEKMVIALREGINYYDFRNWRMIRLFKQYEAELSKITEIPKTGAELKKLLEDAEKIYQKIMDFAYKKSNKCMYSA